MVATLRSAVSEASFGLQQLPCMYETEDVRRWAVCNQHMKLHVDVCASSLTWYFCLLKASRCTAIWTISCQLSFQLDAKVMTHISIKLPLIQTPQTCFHVHWFGLDTDLMQTEGYRAIRSTFLYEKNGCIYAPNCLFLPACDEKGRFYFSKRPTWPGHYSHGLSGSVESDTVTFGTKGRNVKSESRIAMRVGVELIQDEPKRTQTKIM